MHVFCNIASNMHDLQTQSGDFASDLVFGAMQFGGGATSKDIQQMFEACGEVRINRFDAELLNGFRRSLLNLRPQLIDRRKHD